MMVSSTTTPNAFLHPAAIEFNSPEKWYKQGETLANLERYEEALASFNQAIELNPEYCEAWTFKGVVLFHLKNYAGALESCEKALEIRPDDAEAFLFRGAALQRLNRYKEAYTSYNQALEIQEKPLLHRLFDRLSSLMP